MTARINRAVVDLVLEGSVEACTFSAVADRAGIERSTLYRRYADRWEMMIDVWMARAESDVMPNLGTSFAEDLRTILQRLVETLESPLGPALLNLAAALRSGEGSDYSRAYFDRRMAQLEPMFDAAIARGELPAGIDREGLLTFAMGPIYFRMFIAGRPADDAFIASLVENSCAAFCESCG